MENNENENIKPKPVTFKVLASNLGKTTTTENIVNKGKTKKILIFPDSQFDRVTFKHGVTIILAKDAEEDYSELENLSDLIKLDKAKPNLIAGFEPALYIEFIDTQNRSIKTYVDINDMVKVKRKFIDKKGDKPRQVKEIYLKSLNNMTVIIAILEDNDIYLANQLERA